MGERYKVATKETKDILLGKYGQTVKPFNPEVVDKGSRSDKEEGNYLPSGRLLTRLN